MQSRVVIKSASVMLAMAMLFGGLTTIKTWLLPSSASAAASDSTTTVITDLGTLGGVSSRAMGINAIGQVAGYASTESGKMHAFLWDGTMRDLGTLTGSMESFAYAINDAGQIAGASSDLGSITPRAFLWQNNALTEIGAFAPRAINKNGEIAGAMAIKRNNLDWFEHACLWRSGALTDLGTLGGNYSYAYGLNDSGQIVGISFAANEANTRAFVWRNGAMTDLGTLGGASSQAYAINNANAIAGVANLGGDAPHGVLFTLNASGGVNTKSDLGALNSSYSYAYAVNNRGQAVGTNGHAVIWQNGMIADLNSVLPPDSGWALEAATAINEKGQIVGWGKLNGFTRAFLISRVSTAAVASVSAASYDSKLAPEAICSAFGEQLATAIQTANTTPLPTALAGTSLKVRDSAGEERIAPLFFVSPGQINFQVPPETAAGQAVISVISADNIISLGALNIANVAPGLFTANASGRGIAAAVALRIKADGTQSYEAISRFDATQNQIVTVPIDLGAATDQVFLLLFGTGARNRSSLATSAVTIGGVIAPVSFIGAQGDFVGLDQINVALPKNLAGRGEVELTLRVDGNTANPVKLNVR